MFSFMSLGAHVDTSVNMGSGQYVFKICVGVSHEIGSFGSLLSPESDHVPKFAQLYFMTPKMSWIIGWEYLDQMMMSTMALLIIRLLG
jgi:hypothetical protein